MLSGVYLITAHPTKSLINTKYRSCGIIIGNKIFNNSVVEQGLKYLEFIAVSGTGFIIYCYEN
jgi:hypothetical protein